MATRRRWSSASSSRTWAWEGGGGRGEQREGEGEGGRHGTARRGKGVRAGWGRAASVQAVPSERVPAHTCTSSPCSSMRGTMMMMRALRCCGRSCSCRPACPPARPPYLQVRPAGRQRVLQRAHLGAGLRGGGARSVTLLLRAKGSEARAEMRGRGGGGGGKPVCGRQGQQRGCKVWQAAAATAAAAVGALQLSHDGA